MRLISIEAVAIATLLLEGCALLTSRASTVPHVDGRRLANLYALAERDTACPLRELSAWRIDDRVWQVSGCGDTREYAIFSRGFGARWQRITPVGARASLELGCPTPATALEVDPSGVMTASGCGRSAVLQLQCGLDRCEWVTIAPAAPVRTAPAIATIMWTAPAPPPPIVVIPAQSGADPGVERALQSALDSNRERVIACGAAGVVIRGRWAADRVVRFSLDPPWATSDPERCVAASLPIYHVVSPVPGEMTHVVR
jgi:hypothetical protein